MFNDVPDDQVGPILDRMGPHALGTLGEGATPLVPLERLGSRLGVPQLYAKDESQNPTWSYKDRLCSLAVTHAVATPACDVLFVLSSLAVGGSERKIARMANRLKEDGVGYSADDFNKAILTPEMKAAADAA